MNAKEFNAIVNDVTDRMIAYVRPFVTPISTRSEEEVRLIGTGTYVDQVDRTILLTCDHVVHGRPAHFRFFGSDSVFQGAVAWRTEKNPIDVASMEVPTDLWAGQRAGAGAIPIEKFARTHSPIAKEELFFFFGFAGENASYGFDVLETRGSGYCTQEKDGSGDDQIFELHWAPERIQFTSGTSELARKSIRAENPGDFSGSLVWNTRYLEVTSCGGIWRPADAHVSGILRRWDQKTGTLLVWRVEHLRGWLDRKGA